MLSSHRLQHWRKWAGRWICKEWFSNGLTAFRSQTTFAIGVPKITMYTEKQANYRRVTGHPFQNCLSPGFSSPWPINPFINLNWLRET